MPIETFYISSKSTHNKQQAGIKSICTEERGGGGGSYDSYKYVFNFFHISEVSGIDPP